ncbi:G1/S-specific cyclin pas1 [Neolecta irregularis DAH-3]|uniref:G1/S-specific cyclin pas1 n=1 Tax=Neolecta irregularis (strain DAH-3) TaxID=1198029 RepID=A0A1U7LNI1_NEOID|nr:G1/S-specific cyclin pas1 [Neolecta irregularis DAH-3]|eukprot:OLL24102.1 G1/S-specific cyclin pas1 [Neolecta irregularis DAH-3]
MTPRRYLSKSPSFENRDSPFDSTQNIVETPPTPASSTPSRKHSNNIQRDQNITHKDVLEVACLQNTPIPSPVFTSQLTSHSFEVLVEISKILIELRFPDSVHPRHPSTIPLSHFILETIRRSRSSKPVLLVALLLLTKSITPSALCGRREFLASLLVSSKFLNDKNYSNSAWSKISGLSISEINRLELNFCESLDWKIFVRAEEYELWQDVFLKFSETKQKNEFTRWVRIVRRAAHRAARVNAALSVSANRMFTCANGLKRKREDDLIGWAKIIKVA